LGDGSFGTVYKATNISTGRTVAIKVARSPDFDYIRSFLIEERALKVQSLLFITTRNSKVSPMSLL
jgi:serine/threonine protein kinase